MRVGAGLLLLSVLIPLAGCGNRDGDRDRGRFERD